MKTEKIKNYNHYLLAVLGTLGCVILILFAVFMISERIPYRDYNDYDPHGLIAEEITDELNQESLRKQIISYEVPFLVDTLRSVYIIPVSISTLRKPEEIINYEDEVITTLNMYTPRYKKVYHSRKFLGGTYANLLVYDPKKNTTKSIFNERLIIGDVSIYHFDDDILLVFYTASKDTNKNGIIDLDDSKDLCIYSINTARIRRLSGEVDEISSYEFINNSKDMLVQFRLGHYQKNQFDKEELPGRIVKYEYASDKLLDIISPEIQEQMQKLVEGKGI